MRTLDPVPIRPVLSPPAASLYSNELQEPVMSQFDLADFEAQVHALLAAHRRLQADYDALKADHAAETERNREIRERLNGVIERIRALETEAGNV